MSSLAAAGLVLALAASPADAQAGGVYFVKEGDTLAGIGRVFGVSVDSLRATNRLKRAEVSPGDRLRIPDAVKVVRTQAAAKPQEVAHREGIDPERMRQALCREETVYHSVVKGDTLTAIARRYQSTVDELVQLNGLRSRSRLALGQKIVVRKSGPRTHTVRRGESLSRIAARYRVTADDLRRLNGMNDDALSIGQRLIVQPCDLLAAAGSVPPPLGEATESREFLSAVAEAAAQVSRGASVPVTVPGASTSALGVAAAPSLSEQVIDLAKTMLNIPYRFGGTTLRGIDCSAFVQRVFGLVDLQLPRTAREQFGVGAQVDRGELSVGDLVFFRTYASFASHVGIYLGDDLFIHASSVGRRVTIDSLEQRYYRKRFLGGRRLFEDDAPSLAAAE